MRCAHEHVCCDFMKRRKFVASTGAIAGNLLIAGCLGGSNADNSNKEDEEFWDLEGGVGEKSAGNLKVTDLRLFKTSHGTGIMGTVKNTAQDPYTRVSVRVILVDKNNDPVQTFNESVGVELSEGVDTEAIGDLGPGQIWKFTVFFEDISLENVARYRVIVDGEVA